MLATASDTIAIVPEPFPRFEDLSKVEYSPGYWEGDELFGAMRVPRR